MERIIIAVSELNREKWASIYRFIKDIQDGNTKVSNTIGMQNNDFIVSVKKLPSKECKEDICSVEEGELSHYENLSYDSEERVFNIIYTKQDDSEDFSNLVPFFLLEKEFGQYITLGIDITKLDNKRYTNPYYFKCSSFLTCIENKPPLYGEKSIYFILSRINKKTGEIIFFSQKIAGQDNKMSLGNESRRFLPLLKISKDSFLQLFSSKEIVKSNPAIEPKEVKYVKESIVKISNDLRFQKEEIYRSIFEEWFIKAFFYSLKDDKRSERISWDDKLLPVLHAYYNNIFELVQNIIFHTDEKQGLMYFVFNKKENISDNHIKHIVDFEKYNSDVRFLEIGLFDFGKKGIVDNYLQTTDEQLQSGPQKVQWEKDKKDINLLSFFDTKSILTTGITKTDLRHAANMGLKSFVNSIIRYNGYFRVVSNSNKKRKLKNVVEIVQEKIKDYATDKDTITLKAREQASIYFTDGTHYEIILPVKDFTSHYSTSTQNTTQYDSLVQLLIKGEQHITEIPLKEIEQWKTLNKQEQIQQIVKNGDNIIKRITKESNNKAIAINVSGVKDAIYVFKILSYIQFHAQYKFNPLILTQLDEVTMDDICAQIEPLLNAPKESQNKLDMHVWNNNAPVVLISVQMRFQILCGETKNDFLYINERVRYKYPNLNFYAKVKQNGEQTEKKNTKFEELSKRLVNTFYEFNIVNEKGESLFERYVTKILKQPIEGEDIGYLVNHEYTRIGSKIVIKNFYEADTLFQNNFFAERFAYLAAKNIISSLTNNTKSIVLIGYKSYSDSLVQSIKKLLNKFWKRDIVKNYIIANEDEDGDILWKNHDDEIVKNAKNYAFITIVPIGSTLSTNDKIIALFQQHIKKRQNVTDIISVDHIYNHCVIVVRDKITDTGFITDEEKKQKWIRVDSQKKIIITSLQNATEVHFSIQIAAKDEGNNWYSKLDKTFFPDMWYGYSVNKKKERGEEFVNDTHNSSLNSQNLMGYPEMVHLDTKQYEDEYNRLLTFKKYIHYGHIECHKSHYRNYIDTEKYIREQKENPLFNTWIKTLKKHDTTIFNQNTFNLLITPSVNIESDFVETINEKLFDHAALIIHIDINNWRNNIIHKFSYLRKLVESGLVKFHFIDHVLLTGKSYRQAKSYMRSILKCSNYEKFHFTSVITLINRLSYDRNKEIADEIDENIFAYLHLFVPHSKDPERDCSLCKLEEHYEDLKKKTVVESCLQTIKQNTDKIKLKVFDNSFYSQVDYKEKYKRERNFTRLCLTHEIFYKVSEIIKGEDNIDKQKEAVEKMLDIDIYIKRNDKISFLKVISSPPLSQYIQIRNYAHKKLINELSQVLKATPCYDAFCKMRVILKQLSFLKSNALVRKEVIIGAWNLYFAFKQQKDAEIEKMREDIIKCQDNIKQKKNDRKEKIQNLKEILKRETSIYKELEIQDLHKDIININNDKYKILETIKHTENKIKKMKNEKNKNFTSQFQFFIKNSIFVDDAKSKFLGELLRTGEENAKETISATLLQLETENKTNDLFSYFNKHKNASRNQYVGFLVWLFYDNTTIIRKTLQNFLGELNKDSKYHNYFYNTEGLITCDYFISNLHRPDGIKNAFIEKVKNEYYYSSFSHYLNNGDKIDYVEKILCVLYAKLTLKDISDNKHKNKIDKELSSLLQIFAQIMNANVAYFAMKYEKEDNGVESYPVAFWNEKGDIWDSEKWIFNNSLSAKVLKQHGKYKKIKHPMMIIRDIKTYEEEKICDGGKYANILVIHDKESDGKENDKILATITFIYNEESDELNFRIKSQEYGRLLLLLKNEINNYVINYLKNEKVFDLWVERHESLRKFRKIYLVSDHSFGSYEIQDDIDFDELDINNLNKIHRAYFSHTNMIINHIYSNIEQNKKLNMFNSEQPKCTKISNIFNDKFIDLITNGFAIKRWKGCKKVVVNDDYSKDATTIFHKQILRAFVIQCLDNAMSDKHLYSSSKNVNLTITDTGIIIQNDFDGYNDKEEIEKRKKDFNLMRDSIKRLECRNYECMTLTALQGYCQLFCIACDFRYDNNNNFIVEINFKANKYV